MMRSSILVLLCTLGGLTFFACSATDGRRAVGGTDGDDTDGTTGPVDLTPGLTPVGDPTPGCGDKILTSDEACDDGNLSYGDGCAGNCLGVEPGFSCPIPGEPCVPVARCGDSAVVFPEQCDDGNVNSWDGCSSTCKVEVTWKCEGSPSTCTHTVCGDGVLEGAEACEDGNTMPFDGCNEECQREPQCVNGECASECGDGLVLGEDCDDGNLVDGDGCSSSCTTEANYDCSSDASCEKINGECVLRVSAIYRDFAASHSDFAEGCATGAKGIVAAQLDGEGKPVLANGSSSCIASAESFSQWYRTGPVNTALAGKILLMPNGSGGFVNRYGAQGEPWYSLSDPQWCGNVGSELDGVPCTFMYGDTPCQTNAASLVSCVEQNGSWNGLFFEGTYDGNPLFFPVDGLTTADAASLGEAKIAPSYGYDSWPWEKDVTQVPVIHNFYFTTEVNYWFKYDASSSARLDFLGDDDVWVFVNGRLAVDLGGIHIPEDGSVVIDQSAAATYGMTDGLIYPIKVFHAERKMEGSSFKLTLAGFQTVRSDCVAFCGDGVIGMGEQCDDGVNDGGYGECAPGCVLGEFCGDGIVQPGEDCDDGNSLDGDACGSACRDLIIR